MDDRRIFFSTMMLVFVLLLCVHVISQNCGDGDVICIGEGGDYGTLNEGFEAMPPGSVVKYVLITSDLYISNETVYPIMIDSNVSNGTQDSPITIMPDPLAPGQVTIWHDSVEVGDSSSSVLVFQQPYWIIDGVGEKLRIAWSHDCNQNYGTGFIRISGVGTGKFTVKEVLFESFYEAEYPCGVYVYCDKYQACDDTEFDDIHILDNTFHSTVPGTWTPIKIGIESASASTRKVTINGNHMYAEELSTFKYCIYFPYEMYVYDVSTYDYNGGCQNCLITDNTLEDCDYGIYVYSRLQDTLIQGNTLINNEDCFYFEVNDGYTQYPSLENVLVYDNVMECSSESIMIYESDNNGDGKIKLEIKNNQVTGTAEVLNFNIGYMETDILVEGNTFHTSYYFGDMIGFFCGTAFPSDNVTITITNNVFDWDLGAQSDISRSFFFVQGCDHDLTIAYNYFYQNGSGNNISFLEAENYDNYEYDSLPDALESLLVYGNVIFSDNPNSIDFFKTNVSQFTKDGGSVVVEENLFNIDFQFNNDSYGMVTISNNEVDDNLITFDYENICDIIELFYYVPYLVDVTPIFDIDGIIRSTSGNTVIGPKTCFVYVDPDDYFELGRDGSDPSSNSEYGCSTTSIPAGRNYGTGFVFRNNYIYIFGGRGFDGIGSHGLLNDVWRVSSSDSYEWCFINGNSSRDVESSFFVDKGLFSSSNYISSRSSFASFSILRSFFVFGGEIVGDETTNDLWEFNVFQYTGDLNTEHQWRILAEEDDFVLFPDLPTKRMGHCVGHFGEMDDEVFFFGGKPMSGDYYNDLFQYHILNNEWVRIRNTSSNDTFNIGERFIVEDKYTKNQFDDNDLNPPGRFYCTCWVDSNRNFFIFGGQFPNKFPTNDVWMYNQTIENWGFLTGGRNNTESNVLMEAYHQFDPLNLPAMRHSSIFFTNQMKYNTDGGNFVLFYGGMDGVEGNVFADMWLFSNILHQFKFLNGSSDGYNMPTNTDLIGSRSGGMGMTKPSFRVLIFGGNSLE